VVLNFTEKGSSLLLHVFQNMCYGMVEDNRRMKRMTVTVYFGEREDMIAEVAAFDFTDIGVDPAECAYLILPVGDLQYDTDYAATYEDAKEIARDMAKGFGGSIAVV
jgi:hypothetical protein